MIADVRTTIENDDVSSPPVVVDERGDVAGSPVPPGDDGAEGDEPFSPPPAGVMALAVETAVDIELAVDTAVVVAEDIRGE